MKTIPLSLTTAFGFALMALPATAATTYLAGASYDAVAASPGNPDHVIWLPDISPSFKENNSTDAVYTDNADGTASLVGTALASNGVDGFILDIMFTDYSATPPADGFTPKTISGGSVLPSWWYYQTTSGTLTGVGSFAGTDLIVERNGPSFQVGDGANDKTSDFGASGWLNVYEVVNSTKESRGRGDINITLTARPDDIPPPPSVPDGGSTLLLLGAALSGLGFARRKQAK